MHEDPERQEPPRRIDAEAKAKFVAALRKGARLDAAAAAAGFSLTGLYAARRRDPAFKAAWQGALATSAAAERRARAYRERGEGGEVRIAMANRRIYQRRRRRNVRFDAAAREAFLTHFNATCDTKAAAEAAGVHESTVRLHARTDREFAAAYRDALAEGYVRLEAEAVRQRVAAQARLRAAIEAADDWPGTGEGAAMPAACPECGRIDDPGAEFDHVMKLFARWGRQPRRPDRHFRPDGRRQRWTFDQAITLLDKKLRAMGARTDAPPPDEGKE